MNAKKKESFDFEKGMARLDEILNHFDEGEMPLDKMEKNFIEGMELIKKCSERLEQVEMRITKLIGQENGEGDEIPFDEDQS